MYLHCVIIKYSLKYPIILFLIYIWVWVCVHYDKPQSRCINHNQSVQANKQSVQPHTRDVQTTHSRCTNHTLKMYKPQSRCDHRGAAGTCAG